MSEEESIKKALKMIEDNDNIISLKTRQGLEQASNLNNYPISPLMFKKMSQKQYIGMNEDIYNEIIRIRQITKTTSKEVPFYLIGLKNKQGVIFFDKIIINENELQEFVADYKPIHNDLKRSVNNTLDEDIPTRNDLMLDHPYQQLVICSGHTHGDDEVTDNFSFQDISTIIKFKCNTEIFRNGQVEVLNVLINQSGDFNFIKYENNAIFEGIYTYSNIFVKKNNGKMEVLPAYENGKYLYQEELEQKKGKKK